MEKLTNEEYIKVFKEDYLKIINRFLEEDGRLQPAFTVLYTKNGEESPKAEHIVLPDTMLGTVRGKDVFTQVVPKLITTLRDRGDDPICIAWSSEVWVRKGPKEIDPDSEYQMPSREEIEATFSKEEAVVMYFESETESTIDCRLIERDGTRVNSNGDMVDNIVLVPHKDFDNLNTKDIKMQGTFTNLFPKKKTNE